MKNDINELYSLSQSILFYRRKYAQKLSKKDLNNLIKIANEKSGKDLSYLEELIGKEGKEVGLYDIIKNLKEEDIDTFARVFIFQNKGTNKEEVIKQLNIYKKDFKDILSLEKEYGKQIKQGDILKVISKEIFNIMKGGEKEEDIEDILFGGEIENIRQVDKEFEKIADKLRYFQNIRKFYLKYGYVITPREYVMIQDILEDLKKGRLVTLLGETGSGKTELARFISRAFLGKEPIVISGSKFLTDEDFTIEKVVTSKALLDDGKLKHSQTGLSQKEFLDQVLEDTVEKIFKTREFKELLKQKGVKEEEIKEIDFNKYNLFTEYHLRGLFKGMAEGRPVIIDEANLIRPEVIMALNDYFTRRVGDEIELPNGLGKIKIKEGFNIILTGNDPDSVDNARYERRYKFDEATYNRLSVYQKNYYNQKNIKFKESLKEDTYMDDNELYTIILMMLTDKANKYGIEFIKEEFKEIPTEKARKEKIFKDLKRLAIAANMVQRAFKGETITITKVNTDISVSNEIKRKVFSMRNLKDILQDYIDGKESMDYYIYKTFIQKEPNENERYALLVIFHEVGFFENLVSDDKKETLELVDRWYKGKRGKKLTYFGKENNKLDEEIIKSKVIINKYDIMKELFGELKIDLSEEEMEKISENFSVEEETNIQQQTEELSKEELIETIESIVILLGDKYNDIQKLLIQEQTKEEENLSKQEKYKRIADRSYRKREEEKNNSEKSEELKNLEETFKEYLDKIKEIKRNYFEMKETLANIVYTLESGQIDRLTEEELKKIYSCMEGLITKVNKLG